MRATDDQTAADAAVGYAAASIKRVKGENGIEYAYRDLGGGDVPLVLLQHFRGNLDNWDPALVDALAAKRRVVAFDNVGVAATTGRTPNTVEAMAHDAIAFLEAMDVRRLDLLGFSIGSFVAQEIALIRPDLLRRVVLASSAPRGAAGMHGWAAEVIAAVGAPEPNPQGYLDVFFAPTDMSREAGQQAAARIFGRTANRDEPTTWQTRQAQYDAVCTWGIPNHALLERVAAIELPVFVANGDSDPMILPRYSYLLAGLLPDARLTIYPDSAHGFLFQHHERFAADVHVFLEEASKNRSPSGERSPSSSADVAQRAP
jgi:pimeloyl-ACP methyl ester carboxylesterase